jgi:predicted nucleic acid-binding protein
MIVLIDSDVLIEIARGRNGQTLLRFKDLLTPAHSALYSPVSAAELWCGSRPNEFQITTELFESLICVDSTYEIGKLAGELLQKYGRSHALEVPDALIAATTLVSEALLWTCNRTHYPMPELSFYE